MADSKISALTELAAAPASGDLLVLVDVSDTTMAASGTDKKITYANLTSALVSGATTFATSSAQTFTNGINGGTAANDDLTINGTSHATKTSSYVILQPSGGNVGIGTSTPAAVFHTFSTAISAEFRFQNTADSGSPLFTFYRARGSVGAETPIINGARVGEMQFVGYGATAYKAGGYLRMMGNATWTDASAPTDFFVMVTPSGGTSPVEVLTCKSSGQIGMGSSNTSPTAVCDIAASSTTRASGRVRAGTRPTTPNTGEFWDDGALVSYQVSAATNAIVNSFKLERGSSGTPAAGFGLGIAAQLESSTTETQDAGRLTWEWATATHASRAAKGKLTAYYTSTERDAITWTADSAGATVYVNPAGGGVTVGDTTAPGVSTLRLGGTIGGAGGAGLYVDPTTNAAAGTQYGLRILGNPANATDFIGLGIHGSANLTNYRNSIWVGNESGRPGINIGYDYNVAAPEKGLIMAGKLGVGVSSPQAILHGHDGSGGFLFVNRASVGGTLVTVIPDAAGDVTEKIFFVGWCTNSAPFSADVAPTTLTVSSSTTKTDGTNTLTIAVTAGGAFTLQATGGAATWNVNLWVFWR